MTKTDFKVLKVLDDNDADSAITSLSIKEMTELFTNDNVKVSYQVLFHRLKTLINDGYLNFGLSDGAANTFYILPKGKQFISELCN